MAIGGKCVIPFAEHHIKISEDCVVEILCDPKNSVITSQIVRLSNINTFYYLCSSLCPSGLLNSSGYCI